MIRLILVTCVALAAAGCVDGRGGARPIGVHECATGGDGLLRSMCHGLHADGHVDGRAVRVYCVRGGGMSTYADFSGPSIEIVEMCDGECINDEHASLCLAFDGDCDRMVADLGHEPGGWEPTCVLVDNICELSEGEHPTCD